MLACLLTTGEIDGIITITGVLAAIVVMTACFYFPDILEIMTRSKR